MGNLQPKRGFYLLVLASMSALGILAIDSVALARPPVLINGDDQLRRAPGVVNPRAKGTADDPIIIENLHIVANDPAVIRKLYILAAISNNRNLPVVHPALQIENTSLHVVFRNCTTEWSLPAMGLRHVYFHVAYSPYKDHGPMVDFTT